MLRLAPADQGPSPRPEVPSGRIGKATPKPEQPALLRPLPAIEQVGPTQQGRGSGIHRDDLLRLRNRTGLPCLPVVHIGFTTVTGDLRTQPSPTTDPSRALQKLRSTSPALDKGILFAAYATLRSDAREAKVSRVCQIVAAGAGLAAGLLSADTPIRPNLYRRACDRRSENTISPAYKVLTSGPSKAHGSGNGPAGPFRNH